MKVVFIGAGNLATRLALEMQRKGMSVVQVYSHTKVSAECLAEQLNCSWVIELDAIRTDADLYVFSVKDTVLVDLISQIKPNEGLWVHTAGSMPMSVFEGYVANYGVMYPLQTFSKIRSVDFSVIPFFLEASTPDAWSRLQAIVGDLSGDIRVLSSEKRKSLHLAAVFACNFTNHIYALAVKLLAEQGIPANVLLPLIDETAAKVHTISPAEAQTGPAVRYDENVINKHLEMLTDPDMRSIYRLISQSIYKERQHE